MADILRCYRIKFEILPPEEVADDRYGMRSRLGGKPDWEQNDETPVCGSCGKQITFIGQIDSIEHDAKYNPHRVDCLSKNQQYMFGDVGMIYVFFCFECLETTSVFQCT